MSSIFFTFDYDYAKECWNLPRGAVPLQLKDQGVPHALWMHFWDYAQSVVERASVRSIMKDKLQAECHNLQLTTSHNYTSASSSKDKVSINLLSSSRQQRQIEERAREMQKLGEQTSRDFDCLQREADRVFPNSKAAISHDDAQKGRPFGLSIRLLHHSTDNSSSKTRSDMQPSKAEQATTLFHLHYDTHRATWNLPRDRLPSQLLLASVERGVVVSMADWIAVWDYGLGVNQRAQERELLNESHDRELRLCSKSLSHLQHQPIISGSNENSNATVTHIALKMDKLRRAKEANVHNTQKGWNELQRRATLRFEPYGVKVLLSHPASNPSGCGLQFQGPGTVKSTLTSATSTSSAQPSGRQSPPAYQHQPMQKVSTSSVWLHKKVAKEEAVATTPSVWNCGYNKNNKEQPKLRMSSHQPSILTTSPNNNSNVLRPNKDNAHNTPPKPETLRHYHHKSSASTRKEKGAPPPVVLTYVHDEVPSKIEVTTPLSFEDPIGSFDDEDGHGYVVPPAPCSPPSSIGSTSSTCSFDADSSYPTKRASSIQTKKKGMTRHIRFGNNQLREFENPYKKCDKERLWFSTKERDLNRAKTKLLAQRVMESKVSGGSSHNVVFMDSDTEEEVNWRGLEHAQKGNLSSRQEVRRGYMAKVLEKQRALRLDAFTFRRGTPSTDPMGDLQQYAYRQSRHCRDRAQKLAASDAKEARTVYKESLRKANLYNGISSSTVNTVSSKSTPISRLLQQEKHHSQKYYSEASEMYHKNDIFQDYCRQMHLASKARMHQTAVPAA